MTTHINLLYGILAGDKGLRHTTVLEFDIPDNVEQIAAAVCSRAWSQELRNVTAEISLNLLFSSAELRALLELKDPYNSYWVPVPVEPAEEHGFSLEMWEARIKKCGLPGVEKSFLPPDYIIHALKHLMQRLPDVVL